MTVFRHVLLVCDVCEKRTVEGDSAAEVRADARRLGWRHERIPGTSLRVDLCPEHATPHKPRKVSRG